MTKSFRHSDALLALFVVSIATMLLVPLPPSLLDFLLAINISFSLLLLLVSLYMPNALALLAFPSLLLLTTLFRLGLNVASTRLILSDGDAGTVIRAFGTLLIRGEVVVGAIIFTIITIVNYIVVARGSSRVSEVAARFALDALPGKQMSIDSDMRAGLLSPEEARERREDLRKESQLYGSMDGAMKFVQGDAIAGFFIIVTNIVGGMYLGVRSGMTLTEAVSHYTMLTVGDGLVSQIPALLISICAGIVVTRVASGDDTTLGSDVGKQLFRRPTTLMFSSMLLVFIALLPGIPWPPFIVVSLLFFGGALYARRRQLSERGEMLPLSPGEFGSVPLLPGLSGVEDRYPDSARISVSLDAAVLYRLYKLNEEQYAIWWREFQGDYFASTGVMLPVLHVVADEDCAPSHYAVYLGETVIESGRVPLDSVLVDVNPDHAEVFGFEVLEEVNHPLSGSRVFWAVQSPALRRIVSAAQIRAYDFLQFIGLEVAVFCRKFPEEVLTLSTVNGMLKKIEKSHPGLNEAVFATGFVTVSRLTELLQELVREGVTIRDFHHILESVASYCSHNMSAIANDGEFELQELVSYVRQSRRRQLLGPLLSDRRTLRVLTLSDEVEEVFETIPPSDTVRSSLPINPAVFDSLTSSLESLIEPILKRGVPTVTLLCRGELREPLQRFVRGCNGAPGVVTFEELDPQIQVEQVGVWSTEG